MTRPADEREAPRPLGDVLPDGLGGIRIHFGDPAPWAGTVHATHAEGRVTITWPPASAGKVVHATVWSDADGGRIVCDDPLIDGTHVRLCGACEPCLIRQGETIVDAVRDILGALYAHNPSPDCRQGKHGSCTGDAWDDTADHLVPCPCTCHGEGQ